MRREHNRRAEELDHVGDGVKVVVASKSKCENLVNSMPRRHHLSS